MQIGSLIWIGIKGLSLTHEEKKYINSFSISGVILFKKNIDSLSQLFDLCREIHSLKPKPLIMMDREGGPVDRLKHLPEFYPWPAPSILAKKCSLDEIKKTAVFMAKELKALGISINFAPCVDIPSVSNSLFNGRLWGITSEEVSAKALAYLKGLKKEGVAGCIKHFPGHGGVKEDSHLTLPVDNRVAETLYQKDMLSFQKIIAKEVELIMTAHVLYPKLDPKNPATLSPVVLKILREKLKFHHLIVSDDLDMKALKNLSFSDITISALKAGVDILLKCTPFNDWEEITEIEYNILNAFKKKDNMSLLNKKEKKLLSFKNKYNNIKTLSSLDRVRDILLHPESKKWQSELEKRCSS